MPCAILWLFAVLEIYYIKHSGDKLIPKTFINQTKLALTVVITVLTIVDLVYAISKEDGGSVYPVHFYTPVVKIASFVSTNQEKLCSKTKFRNFSDLDRRSRALQPPSWR